MDADIYFVNFSLNKLCFFDNLGWCGVPEARGKTHSLAFRPLFVFVLRACLLLRSSGVYCYRPVAR